MDILTRLAFVASELLMNNVQCSSLRSGAGGAMFNVQCSMFNDQCPIILFNHSSSLAQDRKFLRNISHADNFFPSPSVFVYTLPNITTGEIAIRHHYQGETAFYILPEKDEILMQQILEATLNQGGARAAISGWVDAETDTSFECELSAYVTSKL